MSAATTKVSRGDEEEEEEEEREEDYDDINGQEDEDDEDDEYDEAEGYDKSKKRVRVLLDDPEDDPIDSEDDEDSADLFAVAGHLPQMPANASKLVITFQNGVPFSKILNSNGLIETTVVNRFKYSGQERVQWAHFLMNVNGIPKSVFKLFPDAETPNESYRLTAPDRRIRVFRVLLTGVNAWFVVLYGHSFAFPLRDLITKLVVRGKFIKAVRGAREKYMDHIERSKPRAKPLAFGKSSSTSFSTQVPASQDLDFYKHQNALLCAKIEAIDEVLDSDDSTEDKLQNIRSVLHPD